MRWDMNEGKCCLYLQREKNIRNLDASSTLSLHCECWVAVLYMHLVVVRRIHHPHQITCDLPVDIVFYLAERILLSK